ARPRRHGPRRTDGTPVRDQLRGWDGARAGHDERPAAAHSVVVRQIATGPIPLAVAVDERRGRAVVTNAGGTAGAPDPWAWVPSWLRQRTHGLIPAPSGPRALPASVSVVDTRR